MVMVYVTPVRWQVALVFGRILPEGCSWNPSLNPDPSSSLLRAECNPERGRSFGVSIPIHHRRCCEWPLISIVSCGGTGLNPDPSSSLLRAVRAILQKRASLVSIPIHHRRCCEIPLPISRCSAASRLNPDPSSSLLREAWVEPGNRLILACLNPDPSSSLLRAPGGRAGLRSLILSQSRSIIVVAARA
jgi:hypothetical protein